MKKEKIVMSLLLSATVLVMGAYKVSAASYIDATHGSGTGTIEFTDSDDIPIVDPEDPENEGNPVNPNPNKGDLVLQYVSDFDFGSHKKSYTAQNYPAAPDTMSNGSKVVPFVSTKDMRTDRNTGWALYVTASEFRTQDQPKTLLKGAEVVFTNANYANSDQFSPQISSKATSENLDEGLALTPGVQILVANAKSDKDNNQGFGSYSLALGSLKNSKNGVTLRVPAKTAIDSKTYQATFDWELQPELENVENGEV